MNFEVQKPFTWAGQELVAGDVLEIPDESSKIGPLTRSRFIRYSPDGQPKKEELPTAQEVAQEITAETEPIVSAVKDPRSIVREAKERAKAVANK